MLHRADHHTGLTCHSLVMRVCMRSRLLHWHLAQRRRTVYRLPRLPHLPHLSHLNLRVTMRLTLSLSLWLS
jgi:hypothetical protein